MATTEQSIDSIVDRMIMPEESEESPEIEDQAELSEIEDDGDFDEEVEATSEDEQPDEDAETDESAGQEKPEIYRVKVDGREVEVTLEDLKRDYSGSAYVKQGMQEAAAKRKEAEAFAQHLNNEYQKFLAAVQQAQSTGFLQPPTPPDNTLLDRDPIGYMRAKDAYEQKVYAYNAQSAQIQAIAQQQQAYEAQQMRQYVADQAERLKAEIPEFADPQKARQLQGDLVKAGSDYGFSNDELMGVMDARAIRVLHDAARWRALQSGKAAAKVAPKQKTVQPQGRRDEPAQLARARQLKQAKSSGRIEDFVDALLIKRQ